MTTKPAKTPAPEPAGESLLDLPRLLVAIRRKRRMWLSLAVLGLIAGGLVAVFLPPAPSAVTELLIVHENDTASDSGNLMQTDVAVLQTTKIAGDALKRLGSHESPEKFLKTYEGTGLTSNMMRLEVTGTSERDAVRRAKALADAFIADHVSRTQEAADADAKALIVQRDRTQAELTKVNNQISSAQNKIDQANQDKNGDGQPDGPANGGVSATESESLYARRAELTAKISDLSNRAETAGIGAPRVAAGTQIVDAPRAVAHSMIVTGATNAAIGFGLMLAAGIAIAAVGGVVRDRPVLRKDIAENLGASVIAQLSAPRRGPSRLWRAKRAVRERRRVAGTLVRLVRSGAGPVSVLELGSPRIAAALALDVAAELANDRDVVIIEDPAGRVIADDLPGRDLDELTGRADRPIRIIGADETAPRPAGETRVGIGSITPGTSWTDLRHLGVETLLVVRTGFAETAWLHTVARQLADCRIPIAGVVLVDPDPRDKSDGTLWDSLHTALRGRGLPEGTTRKALAPAADAQSARSAPEPFAAPARTATQAPLPANAPTATPAPVPVAAQTTVAAPVPTTARTATPAAVPTSAPVPVGTATPDPAPTEAPATAAAPAAASTATPDRAPAPAPTGAPTTGPTAGPTAARTSATNGTPATTPTAGPTPAPTAGSAPATNGTPNTAPAPVPTAGPTAPTPVPNGTPTATPVPAPNGTPTTGPTTAPATVTTPARDGEPDDDADFDPFAKPTRVPDWRSVSAAEPEPAADAEYEPAWEYAPAAKATSEDTEDDDEPDTDTEARPEWTPAAVATPTPAPPAEDVPQIPVPASEPVPGAKHDTDPKTEPRTKPAEEPQPIQQPAPSHYPAPVPANGARNNADLPTKRFAPVQPHLMNGNGSAGEQSVHDLPTKRFAPVRPEDVEELAHRRTKS